MPLEDGPAIDNAAVRERLADWYVEDAGLALTRFRTLTALSRGETPGPENSIGKLVSAPKPQEIASFGMDLLDMGGVVIDKEWRRCGRPFQESLLASPGGRIAGGTDEILRNIIAERVLGLPQDVRVDRDCPSTSFRPGPLRDQTRSRLFSPRSPLGLAIRKSMTAPNATTSRNSDPRGMKAAAVVCSTPNRRPPTMAP